MSLFPTEEEQIAYIDTAESVNDTPSAFSMFISQNDIDHILRTGGNADDARMKIATEFSKQKPVEDRAVFLKSLYYGGNGLITENGRFSAWYGDDGIHIAKGDADETALSYVEIKALCAGNPHIKEKMDEVQELCSLMGVSRSGYYKWKKRDKNNSVPCLLLILSLYSIQNYYPLQTRTLQGFESSCPLLKKDFGKNYCPCPLLKKQFPQKCSSCLLLKKQIKNKHFSCLLFLTTTLS